ncbi:N4-gp56 family major capsid protein [Citrobacter freundii]|uniref:N4-gp56 family major capsid protein n=1 Tax=Citrobacter freundii TaxID=546 RepID=UPI0019058CA7|nr:N4-gp56 family major capsid protein [Citrobacter freundii]MBJ9306964.1 N4-gp56 family major capsid protein [Citrobacter freundii]
MTTVTSAQANKVLQAALFVAANRNRSFVNMLTENAPKNAQGDNGKRSAEQSSPHAPVVRVTDLARQAGDEVDVDIFFKLNKRPTMGDKKLEGRGENLEQSTFGLKINQGRHMVNAGGRMSQKRTKHNLGKTARTLLGTYYNDLADQICTVQMMGARGDVTADDIIVPLADDAEFAEIMVNDVNPPTYGRQMYGGDATSLETLDSADLFTLDVVDNLSLYLSEMAHPLAPIKLAADEMSGDSPYYVMFVTPRQWNDWYTSTSGKDWQMMAAAAINRSKGFNHPIFKGDTAMWRNILVRQYSGMPVRFNAGSNVTVCNNDKDATTKIVTTTTMVDRAVLLGGQAIANAYGSGEWGSPFQQHTEKVDHGNTTETSIRWINGLKKIRFRGKDGYVQDFGTICVDTAVSQTNNPTL